MTAQQLDLVRGETLRGQRMKLGLSNARLAKTSGVSRRHISDAEKGMNISCDVLKRLARALNLTEITFDDGLTVRMGSLGADMLGSLLAEITESAENIVAVAAATRALSRTATPEEETLNRQTEELLHGLGEIARTNPTADKVRALQHTLDALGIDRAKNTRPQASPPRRKRITA